MVIVWMFSLHKSQAKNELLRDSPKSATETLPGLR